MSWTVKLLELYRRFGKPAKFAATAVLGALLPGSPAVLSLVDQAFESAEEKARDQWEMKVDKQLEASSADLERLSQLLEVLQTDLQHLTAQVARLPPEVAPQLIETSLASDPRAQEGARRVEDIAGRFERLEQQQKKLLKGQEEMWPLLRRAVGVCDFVDELRAGGFSAEVFGELLRSFQEALRLLGQGKVDEAQRALERVQAARPLSCAATVALAAAQSAGQNFFLAEQTLTQARRLRPEDLELVQIHSAATSLSRRVNTPVEKPRPTTRQPREGETLDGWRLEKLLGHGGWGLVFRAGRGERTMALKVLHGELSADAGFVERFKREIMTLTRLGRSPGLVEIDSFGYAIEHGCWYFVMEWVDGITLEQRLARDGELPWPAARELFAHLAEGLAAAHARGIVHRDVKPANIMLRPDGRAVLVDFGLALEGENSLTLTGRSSGYTALFAAPEQMRKGQADARSDVYSLAASLYYALTFSDPEKREPHRFKPRHVPEPARDLLSRALDNDPSERPADAAAFRDALLGTGRALVVDAEGRGGPGALAQAVREARAGSTITVRPGVYTGPLLIDRAITIVGDGPRDRIILESPERSAIVVRGEETTVRGLTLRGLRDHAAEVLRGTLTLDDCVLTSPARGGAIASGPGARLVLGRCLVHETKEQGVLVAGGASADVDESELACTGGVSVEVQQGGKLNLARSRVHDSAAAGLLIASADVSVEHCVIEGSALANVLVKRGGKPTIRNCIVRDSKQVGLFFVEGGSGLVEDCDVHGNARAGIESKHDSSPTVRRTKVHDGRQAGLFFCEGGRGLVEECDIFGNDLSGVEIKDGGDPVLRQCRIHDGKANGIHVYERGKGTIEDCAIFGHPLQGISVKDGSQPSVLRCRVHDNKECGILVFGQGRGLFEGCEVLTNGLAGIEIKQEGEPIFRHCSIHGGKQCGVFVSDRGRGLLEDCDIFDTGRAGVEIKDGGDPVLRRCSVRDGRTSGVFVYDEGRGTLEDCDVRGNHLQGVAIKRGGRPVLRRTRIHDGKECGVFVYERGAGLFEECAIFANGLANVEVKEEGNPVFRRCNVHDGRVCGVLVWVQATGRFEDCDITGNTFAGVEIKQGGNPTLVRCRITKNGGSALYIHEMGTGVIEGCDLRGNKLRGWDVGSGCRVRRSDNVE